MGRPSDSPGFKSLKKEWYEKLKESGFKDLEHGNPDLPIKASGTERRFQRMDEITREARTQYYRRVQSHVAQAKFRTPRERDILNLYAQGVSQAMIMRVLGIEGNRCRVNLPIYRWLRRWGLK